MQVSSEVQKPLGQQSNSMLPGLVHSPRTTLVPMAVVMESWQRPAPMNRDRRQIGRWWESRCPSKRTPASCEGEGVELFQVQGRHTSWAWIQIEQNVDPNRPPCWTADLSLKAQTIDSPSSPDAKDRPR